MLLYDEDAESALLSAMLCDPFSIRRMAMHVSVNDFYLEYHQHIAQAIFNLGFGAERVSVAGVLADRGQLDVLPRGEAYLGELIREGVSSNGAEALAARIVDRRKRREVLEQLSQFAKAAHNLGQPVDEAIRIAAAQMAAMSQSSIGHKLTLAQIADSVATESKARFEGKWKDTGLRTGLNNLDGVVQMEPGQLVTIAGRPASGKSVLLNQIALKTAMAKMRTKIFSYEMGDKQTLTRMVQCMSGVGWAKGGERKLTAVQQDTFFEALRRIKEMPLDIDTTTTSIAHAIAACEADADNGLRLVVIDYIQIGAADIGPAISKRNVNRDTEIGVMTSALKQLSRRINATVIIGSQLNRAADGNPPTLGTMRESGSIENDSDIVLGIHQPFDDVNGKPHETARDIHVLKNREGIAGDVVHAYFDGKCKRMAPPAPMREEL